MPRWLAVLFWCLIWDEIIGVDIGVEAQLPQNHDLFVFAVDGLASNCLTQMAAEDLPEFVYWKNHGTWTLDARNQWTTDSSTNWASILYANPITIHGISSNAWEWFPTISARNDQCEYVGSLFQGYKAFSGSSNVQTHLFSPWPIMHDLVRSAPIDFRHHTTDDAHTEQTAQTVLNERLGVKPGFYFIYFSNVDQNGHSAGWCSLAYRQAVIRTFERIAHLRYQIATLAARPWTMAIVSDHGGRLNFHSIMFEREVMTVPLMFLGTRIVSGAHLDRRVPLNIQVGPTLLAAGGYPHPPDWNAWPVYEALNGGANLQHIGVNSIYPANYDPTLPECTFIYPYHFNIIFYLLPWFAVLLVAMLIILVFFCVRDGLRLFHHNIFSVIHDTYKIL